MTSSVTSIVERRKETKRTNVAGRRRTRFVGARSGGRGQDCDAELQQIGTIRESTGCRLAERQVAVRERPLFLYFCSIPRENAPLWMNEVLAVLACAFVCRCLGVSAHSCCPAALLSWVAGCSSPALKVVGMINCLWPKRMRSETGARPDQLIDSGRSDGNGKEIFIRDNSHSVLILYFKAIN